MWDTLTSPPALWFAVPAFAGTALFTLKLAMLMFGGDSDDPGAVDATHADSGPAAELFSVGSVLAFLMGFGWGGLSGVLALKWPPVGAAMLGIGTGTGMVGLFVLMMRGLRRLNASGNIELASTAGRSGEVTLAVPAAGGGRGEVRLILGDREKRCDAVSAGEALPTRTRVKVSGVNADNTVTVERV